MHYGDSFISKLKEFAIYGNTFEWEEYKAFRAAETADQFVRAYRVTKYKRVPVYESPEITARHLQIELALPKYHSLFDAIDIHPIAVVFVPFVMLSWIYTYFRRRSASAKIAELREQSKVLLRRR